MLAVLTIATALMGSAPQGFGGAPAARAEGLRANCNRSRLVLLQGLATDTSYGPPYFADILNAIGALYSGATYFSYNLNDPNNYSEQDSLQSVSRSVEALHRAIQREIANCDGVSIDLIGHSNGGVVALRYLAMYGPSTAEGSHIRHLVTLDSPVNGISADQLSTLIQAAALFGIDLSYLQSTDAVRDLVATYHDPGSPQRNINLARSLSSKVGVLTMGSDDDLVVPYPSASIPGFGSEWSLGVVSSLCPAYPDACVGHNQILHDPAVLAKIAGFLQGGAGSSASSGNSAPAPSSGGCNGWSGSWSTDFGGMQLTVSGNSVTGTYVSNSGMLTGTISGNRLNGTWTELPARQPPDNAGDFQFTLASGGGSFTGQWRYDSTGDWQPWSGTCGSS